MRDLCQCQSLYCCTGYLLLNVSTVLCLQYQLRDFKIGTGLSVASDHVLAVVGIFICRLM